MFFSHYSFPSRLCNCVTSVGSILLFSERLSRSWAFSSSFLMCLSTDHVPLSLLSFYLQASSPRLNIHQTAACDVLWCKWSNVSVYWNNFILFLHFSLCQLTKNNWLFAFGFTWEFGWLISKSSNFLWNLKIPFRIYNNKSSPNPEGWYSSVGIATRYGLDGPGIEFRLGGEIFRTRPDLPWGPPSLLYNAYRVFPGVKAFGAWCRPPTPI